MPNVKFNLKPEEGERLIILLFRFQGTKFQYSTSQKIDPRFWDKKKCRARRSREFPGYKALNKLLDKLERTTQDAYRECLAIECDDVSAAIRDELDKAMRRGVKQAGKTFFDFIERLIEERKGLPEYSERTIKGYITCLNKLRDFERETSAMVDFNTIDLDFSLDLQKWMRGKGLSTNYIHKILQTVRAFMTEAGERGLTENRGHKSKRFQVQAEEVQNIYLTTKELAELYHLKLDERLGRVRDLFIIGAFTGLRFSDFKRIQPEHVQGDTIIIRTRKTGRTVHIPIHPFVRATLERYDNLAPGSISSQKFNAYIKEVCRIASWGNENIMVKKRGGRVDVRKEKWEMVSSHTCRRSFCTNAYLAGIAPIDIMKISGHQTEKAFLKYIKVSGEKHARIIGRHEFFNTAMFNIG